MVIAMESRPFTTQHDSLPVALVFYRKQNVKLLIWPHIECNRPERFVEGRFDDIRWKLKELEG